VSCQHNTSCYFRRRRHVAVMPPRRAPINYLAELGQQRAAEVVREKHRDSSDDNSTGCWLFTGSKNNDGYGQVFRKKNSELHLTGRASQTTFLLHVCAYLARTGLGINGQASHLCDNRSCFNPDHIMDEPPQVNNSRKGCPGQIICGFHHHIIVDLCPHRPTCIRPERYDISCCLALKESDPEGWATETSRAHGTSSSSPAVASSAPSLQVPTIPPLQRQSSDAESSERSLPWPPSSPAPAQPATDADSPKFIPDSDEDMD